MKYIRTKDGRIAIVRLQSYDSPIKMIVNRDVALETEDNIVKESDNIEELFDVIDEFFPNKKRPYCELHYRNVNGKLYRYWKPSNFAEPLKGKVIRGGIYTDKGLIYVAKMNEKGEWKFL